MSQQSQKQDIAEDLVRVGGQHAVTKRYRHPSFMEYIHADGKNRGRLDIEKIKETLEKTLSFIESCGEKKRKILFVSTRRETVDLVRDTARNLSQPFMVNRWIGGTISNFKNIRGRVDRLEKLKSDREEGQWTKRTKKEKALLNRDLAKLENKFFGIVSLEAPPAAVFILDTRKENVATDEANNAGIPVIGFSGANADLLKIQHPIIANIRSRDAVAYILGLVEKAYQKGEGGVTGADAASGADTAA